MLFAEEHARLLLVVHAVLGAALVAVSTHLVVWMRGFPRGKFQRWRATRKFALIAASLFLLELLVGNAIYPVYKVRVRAEYLDLPGEVVRDLRDRMETRARVHDRYQDERSGTARLDDEDPVISEPAVLAESAELPRQTARVALWFDVKEHWVALGAALSITCCVILMAWRPRKHGRSIATVVFLMALGAALSAWLGALIGVLVTSYRSIGGIG